MGQTEASTKSSASHHPVEESGSRSVSPSPLPKVGKTLQRPLKSDTDAIYSPAVNYGTAGAAASNGEHDLAKAASKCSCCGGDKLSQIRRRRLADTPDLLFEARLASEPVARRLGAIPLVDDPSILPTQPEMVSGPTAVSLPVLGMVSSALCLAGCLVKRYYSQLKARIRRDSLGFLPDSRRPSLTKAELAV